MSGEPITVVANANADITRFIDSVNRLRDDLPEWVRIGGVAVVLRVGSVDRATVDIDSLTRQADRLIEVLIDRGGQRRGRDPGPIHC